MPKKINTLKDIKPGEFYEDCNYHPCLCVKTYCGMVDGISLIDGSYPRNCGVPQCLIRKLTLKEALEWKLKGPQSIDDPIAFGLIEEKWWVTTPLKSKIKKDKSIIDVLSKLSKRLGKKSFDIVDHWESDLCAIGIAKPTNHDVLVYLQTFGNKPGKYDINLELPSKNKKGIPYIHSGMQSKVTFNQLVKTIISHFKIDENALTKSNKVI